jgi:hypothetical protein
MGNFVFLASPGCEFYCKFEVQGPAFALQVRAGFLFQASELRAATRRLDPEP